MTKFQTIHRYLGKYLLFATPLVVALLIWSAFLPGVGDRLPPSGKGGVSAFFWEVLGVHLIVWLTILFYFFVALLVSDRLREMMLTRLARLSERDEREEFIVGRAAKASWLSTLALLMFLLVVSGLHVRVSELPPQQQKPGRSRALSIGYGFSLLQKSAMETRYSQWGKPPFSFSGTTSSKSAMLLIILMWHTLSFHLFSRKWSRKC